jgi:hypothetical protein
MSFLKLNSLVLMLMVIFLSCGSRSSNEQQVLDSSSTPHKEMIAELDPTGSYVTAEYAERKKGYDWVSVNIEAIGVDKIGIKIRSRADIKKPTCTLDAEADKVGAGIFQAKLPNGTILFKFNAKGLAISPKSENDVAALYFYCSGGATLAGDYHKTEEKLDTAQLNTASRN